LKNLKSTRVVSAILFCLMLLPAVVAAAPAKVAVLPFTINSDKDYTFLQKGIVEMLSSRLASPGKVEVVDPLATTNAMAAAKGLSGDKLAQAVAGKLGADVAIFGSLTVLGESVSIDAKTLDITGGRQPLTFFKQTSGMGEVIPQINLMAGEINATLFGVAVPAVATAAPAVAAGAGAAAAAATVQPDIHMHPEKLLQSGQVASPEGLPPSPLVNSTAAPAQQSSTTLNPAFVAAPGTQADGNAGFWKSRSYTHLISGVEVGDVDKDGLQETVVATPDKIFIYRFAQGKQQSVAEIEAGSVRFISVSIGDINANGTPEIFVTGFATSLNALESSVYEYDGRAFTPIVENSRYYYSVVRHPALGAILLGQKQTSNESIFADPIFEMSWKGGEYVPERQVLKARKGNLLGFAYGDIMQNDGESAVVLDEDDRLRLLTPDGKRQWLSEDKYGGTTLHYLPPAKALGDINAKTYLPVRIRTADLDGNGKLEVLAIQNHDRARRLMIQQRIFSTGRIEALVWDGLGLAPAWQTRQLSGRIQDFAIGDFDNDGVNELLIGIVSKEGAVIFTDAQSSLVAFDLKPAP